MTETEQDRIADARESFSGRQMTDAQFQESWALAGMMERHIRRTGSFSEKLTDYSHAFARNEKFDAMKGESYIRDQFRAQFGETMNQMRERLQDREGHVRENQQHKALEAARSIEPMIREGETMPFWQAHDHAATRMARDLDITEATAKVMMKEAFETAEGVDLYDHSKAVEQQFHAPKREAEIRAREQARDERRDRSGERAQRRAPDLSYRR